MTLTNGVLQVDAQSNSLIGTYVMKVTMTTPDSGNQVWNTVNVVLNYCVITGLAKPTAPTTLAYTIFALNKLTIDMSSPGFQQVPACGYYLVETYTWTIPSSAPIKEFYSTGGSPYIIDIESTDPTKNGNYLVTLALSAFYPSTELTFTQSISFSVTVTDPCLTLVYTSFTL